MFKNYKFYLKEYHEKALGKIGNSPSAFMTVGFTFFLL